MKYSCCRIFSILLLRQPRIITAFQASSTSIRRFTSAISTSRDITLKMEGLPTPITPATPVIPVTPATAHNIIKARAQDALKIAVFAGENFALTFGHLYPAEDTARFLASDYTEDIFLAWIVDSEYGAWVALSEDENVVGYVIAGAASLPRTDSSSGEVKKLYVDRSQFGKGLANTLFELSVSWLRVKYPGFPIYIGVYSENFRAIKFYNRYKFELYDEYIYEVGNCRDREFILKETDSTAGLPQIKNA